ncbi:hypothetical protein ACX80R_15110 [Paeniglutamicibacter antarcticus]
MSSEKESRARQQHIHELRNQLKGRIHEMHPGTDQHRELIRQLEALDADNDAAQLLPRHTYFRSTLDIAARIKPTRCRRAPAPQRTATSNTTSGGITTSRLQTPSNTR